MDNLHETQFFDSVDKEVQNEAKNILQVIKMHVL